MTSVDDTLMHELLGLSQRLLDCIDQQDWKTYTELCDPELTAFEPEAIGHLVTGMPFHQFYFDLHGAGRPKRSTISAPDVRVYGETAVITYTRLLQFVDDAGTPDSKASNETRIWTQTDGRWRHVHFHRSAC